MICDESSIDQDGISEFGHLVHISACRNKKITSVNHLRFLKKIFCGIKQNGISEPTNLDIFDTSNNIHITSVNHLEKLMELDCSYNSSIDI